jgi:hypothetical protein
MLAMKLMTTTGRADLAGEIRARRAQHLADPPQLGVLPRTRRVLRQHLGGRPIVPLAGVGLGLAHGFMAVAAMTMVLSGFFQVVEGIAALSQNEIFLASIGYLFWLDLPVWEGNSRSDRGPAHGRRFHAPDRHVVVPCGGGRIRRTQHDRQFPVPSVLPNLVLGNHRA